MFSTISYVEEVVELGSDERKEIVWLSILLNNLKQINQLNEWKKPYYELWKGNMITHTHTKVVQKCSLDDTRIDKEQMRYI